MMLTLLIFFKFSVLSWKEYPLSRNKSGFPRWLSGKESACQCRRPGFAPWVGKIPWRRKWEPTPVFLPGKSHGQRSLVGDSPWGHKRVGCRKNQSVYRFLICIWFLFILEFELNQCFHTFTNIVSTQSQQTTELLKMPGTEDMSRGEVAGR